MALLADLSSMGTEQYFIPEPDPIVWSAHGTAGAGIASNDNASFRLGGEGEFWVGERWGLGVSGGVFDASSGGLGGTSHAASFGGPIVAFRSASSGTIATAGVSAGLSRQIVVDDERGFCLDSCPSDDDITRTVSLGGYAGIGLSLLAHWGPFEIGPVLQLDVVLAKRRMLVGTLNLALGAAL